MFDWIAEITGARSARRGARIQALWSGYGELFRVELEGASAATAIVKWVRPPPRSTTSDVRKRRSYEVELAFYQCFAPRCDATCRVARLYGARTIGDETLFVLEDLDAAGFSARHDDASGQPLADCLRWLAAFHARFLGEAAGPLWPIGTYWHLATRMDELAAIADRSLVEVAPIVEAKLAAAQFQTIVHGDPKEANFCFARDGVAAVDFQYAGRGCAMKDVAYLLYGRRDDPAPHLDIYFRALRAVLGDTSAIEVEWRGLYPLAKLDFCRFLAGWAPASWRHDREGQRFVRETIAAIAHTNQAIP